MHPLGAELGKAYLTALTIFAAIVWRIVRPASTSQSAGNPEPSSTRVLAPHTTAGKASVWGFSVPQHNKCCAQRCLDLQGVEMKIPKPNYQMKFISSWHTKHPLAIGTPATNSLQFSPSSFLGSCTYLASIVITWLSHRYSWSTGGRWYSSSRWYKLWLPA